MRIKVIYLFRLLLLLFISTSPGILCAQNLILKNTVPINSPGAVSIDRLDNIYVADQKNNLHKLDANGKTIQTFSPPTQAHINLVEAWNPVKILVFQDDRQQIILLDRFLTTISSARLADLTDGIIRTATLANDDQFWLLNESDFTLTKRNLFQPQVALNTPLNLLLDKKQYDIRFMREYQNNLYLVDRLSGIYIFDNMGNYKKRLPVMGISYLGFKGNEAYYLKENKITFIDLYTLKERSLLLPTEKNYRQVLVGTSQAYLFSDNSLDIHEIIK